MQYGHPSTNRAPKNTSTFNKSPRRFGKRSQFEIFGNQVQSILKQEKDFLFGPWEQRARRSEFEPSHADIQDYISDYISGGGKITRLESSEPMTVQKTGTLKQFGNGFDSGSSILC